MEKKQKKKNNHIPLTYFMLNSAEHEIFSANMKYLLAEKFSCLAV